MNFRLIVIAPSGVLFFVFVSAFDGLLFDLRTGDKNRHSPPTSMPSCCAMMFISTLRHRHHR